MAAETAHRHLSKGLVSREFKRRPHVTYCPGHISLFFHDIVDRPGSPGDAVVGCHCVIVSHCRFQALGNTNPPCTDQHALDRELELGQDSCRPYSAHIPAGVD